LRLERVGWSITSGFPETLSGVPTFNKETTARGPRQTHSFVALQGDDMPALIRLDPLNDVYMHHRTPPLARWTLFWTLSGDFVCDVLKTKKL
jgi:hypothetical protein